MGAGSGLMLPKLSVTSGGPGTAVSLVTPMGALLPLLGPLLGILGSFCFLPLCLVL